MGSNRRSTGIGRLGLVHHETFAGETPEAARTLKPASSSIYNLDLAGIRNPIPSRRPLTTDRDIDR
jgi:hypothetical protein